MQISTPEETAVCNLASLGLPSFVRPRLTPDAKSWDSYDFEGLMRTTRMLVRNINKVIDRTLYPVPEAEHSNLRHRPMSIGVQGLSDVFVRYGLGFDDAESCELNRRIFASMYYAAVDESITLAEEQGPYETYDGSPASKGLLQYDLWDVKPHPMHDWAKLKRRLAENGMRNSLLIGLMPTASTATILGNHECFEPITSNLFTRRTLTGEHIQLNADLVLALEAQGLWDDEMRSDLLRHRGSVQKIDRVSDDLKRIFRTAYEIPMRSVIDMSADRGAYVCQGSSNNLFFPTANPTVITAALFHAWERGEKNGSYYVRTRVDAIEEPSSTVQPLKRQRAASPPSMEVDDDCGA